MTNFVNFIRFFLKLRSFRKIIEDPNENFLTVRGKSVTTKVPKFCPHQGAPLKNSIVYKDFLICHWHGCQYDLKNKKWLKGKECLNAKTCF